jgi:uncharacterized protein (DUF58 family)
VSSDSHFSTGTRTDGLTNARTRIVGSRTGYLADFVVSAVRLLRSMRRGLRRFVRRAADVVTPLGWTIVTLVPLGFVFGYGLGWLELVAAAFACLVLLVVAVVYLIGGTRLQVGLTLPQSRTVVGEPVTGELSVANPGRLRTLGITLEVPVGAGLAEIIVPAIGPRAERRQEFTVPATRRGVITVGPVRTVRADPLGLVRREHVWTAASELFVHPRTIGIPSMSTGFVRDLEGSPTRELSTSDISFHALREYSAGDERRHIHWKSTAKTGTYMVRQFEQTKRSHLVIALSLAAADYTTDEEFEMAVSVAGSLGARAIRDTRDVSVIVSESTPEFAKRRVFAVRSLSTISRNRLLDELAVVEHSPAALPLVDVARVASGRVPGVSLAFLICGSATSPSELRAASTKFPVGVEVIAVVCDPETIPGLRQVAGLSVLTIGYLDELNRALSGART